MALMPKAQSKLALLLLLHALVDILSEPPPRLTHFVHRASYMTSKRWNFNTKKKRGRRPVGLGVLHGTATLARRHRVRPCGVSVRNERKESRQQQSRYLGQKTHSTYDATHKNTLNASMESLRRGRVSERARTQRRRNLRGGFSSSSQCTRVKRRDSARETSTLSLSLGTGTMSERVRARLFSLFHSV